MSSERVAVWIDTRALCRRCGSPQSWIGHTLMRCDRCGDTTRRCGVQCQNGMKCENKPVNVGPCYQHQDEVIDNRRIRDRRKWAQRRMKRHQTLAQAHVPWVTKAEQAEVVAWAAAGGVDAFAAFAVEDPKLIAAYAEAVAEA